MVIQKRVGDAASPLRQIEQAIRDADVEQVEVLLDRNPDVLVAKLWFPAILVAGTEMCQLLLARGLDPNESGADRKPLHFAAEQGRTDLVMLLLESGADPNIRDRNGATPLDQACEFGADAVRPELIPLLVTAGTELSFATCLRIGQLERVRSFLDEEPGLLDQVPPTGIGTPLMMASRCGRTEVVAELLHRGADVNAVSEISPSRNHGGNAALWFAAQGRRPGRGPLVKLLIEAGADIDFQGEHGETALHVAVAWNHADVAEVLLKAGANPNLPAARGDTPLDFALRWEFKESRDVLLRYGCRAATMAMDGAGFAVVETA